MATPRRILIIAGSDSSGGAGIEADQRVVALHGCYAMTVTTALTAQNTQGVAAIHPTPSSFVVKQLQSCVEDVEVDVVKIGMLGGTETARLVAKYLCDWIVAPIVLDPVMVSSTGSQLLPPEAISTVVEELLPITTILTPNIPEAKLLLGKTDEPDPRTSDEMEQLAKELQKLGPRYVLLKGGHYQPRLPMEGRQLTLDVLVSTNEVVLLEKDFINTNNTHGTGCSLASAIASHIASGDDIPRAVRKACQYVEAGIRSAFTLGRGNGPINHFHSSFTLPFAPGYFFDYLLNREDVNLVWNMYTEHAFVRRMADGSLPQCCFESYMIQDHLFLIQYARAQAISASKRNSINETAAVADESLGIQTELDFNINFLKRFGFSIQEVESMKPSESCLAYTRYLLDIAHSSDRMAFSIACAPCLIGYGDAAAQLYNDSRTLRGQANPYWQWIEFYVANDYVKAVQAEKHMIETNIVLESPSKIEELVKLFIEATELEIEFWATAEGFERASD